jgi:hypothetical protein
LKSAPGYATFDTSGYVRAMERMKTLASDIKFIIPGHDALLFSRFPTIAAHLYKALPVNGQAMITEDPNKPNTTAC